MTTAKLTLQTPGRIISLPRFVLSFQYASGLLCLGESARRVSKPLLTLHPFVQNPLRFLLLRDLDSNPRAGQTWFSVCSVCFCLKKESGTAVPRGRTFLHRLGRAVLRWLRSAPAIALRCNSRRQFLRLVKKKNGVCCRDLAIQRDISIHAN
jgi:hypothetical protein